MNILKKNNFVKLVMSFSFVTERSQLHLVKVPRRFSRRKRSIIKPLLMQAIIRPIAFRELGELGGAYILERLAEPSRLRSLFPVVEVPKGAV